MSNGKPCQSDWQWHQHSFGDRQQIMLWTYTNISTTKGMEYASTKAIAHSAASDLVVEDLHGIQFGGSGVGGIRFSGRGFGGIRFSSIGGIQFRGSGFGDI